MLTNANNIFNAIEQAKNDYLAWLASKGGERFFYSNFTHHASGKQRALSFFREIRPIRNDPRAMLLLVYKHLSFHFHFMPYSRYHHHSFNTFLICSLYRLFNIQDLNKDIANLDNIQFWRDRLLRTIDYALKHTLSSTENHATTVFHNTAVVPAVLGNNNGCNNLIPPVFADTCIPIVPSPSTSSVPSTPNIPGVIRPIDPAPPLFLFLPLLKLFFIKLVWFKISKIICG